MNMDGYNLSALGSDNFEHLVNALAIRVLGAGLTTFGPGPDGGRDGYFDGQAPYPSTSESWSGRWYIQSKFHAPHLSTDAQKWLQAQIRDEIKEFQKPNSKRKVPDIWIVATNVEMSATPGNGTYDVTLEMVKKLSPSLAARFHIWSGNKVVKLLTDNTSVAQQYAQFITPGHVISSLYQQLNDATASLDEAIRYWTVTQLSEQQYTKLEQAGSAADKRPGIHRLFTDLPFRAKGYEGRFAARELARTIAEAHDRSAHLPDEDGWRQWRTTPPRAATWFIKGGPGNGKSTITQYMAQIQRAALILSGSSVQCTPAQRAIAEEVRQRAVEANLWPAVPRIPVIVELKEYAKWFGLQGSSKTRKLISYIKHSLDIELGSRIEVGALKRGFQTSRWFFVFDGLDEVPGDVKDAVAKEVIHFVEDVLVACGADGMVVCTSRPQGYSGQFGALDAATIELVPLSPVQALACATPLLLDDRPTAQGRALVETLKTALDSPAIAELMTTPLQSHIMAVIVRDGGRPPERRWKLFNTFYEVIKRREANRNLPDKKLSALLRDGDKLLKAIHDRLGFELHARAEKSSGATTAIPRDELKIIVTSVVKRLQDKDVSSTVQTVMRATTERLVLVNTPENGEYVRFDIRPLQEFFAAEYLYRAGDASLFEEKVRIIAVDTHWREVMHFLLSALVENERSLEFSSAVLALEQLDNHQSSSLRALNRRIARGAYMAYRLLAEGVVEQDKDVRAKLQNAVSALAAQSLVEQPDLRLQRHSTAWFIDVLSSTLRLNSENESLGSLILLSYLVNDRNKQASVVSKHILGLSMPALSAFLSAFEQDHFGTKSLPSSKWIIRVVLQILARPNWSELTHIATHVALSIIGTNVKTSAKLASDAGFPDALVSRFEAIFGSGYNDFATRETQKIRQYGILETELIAPNRALSSFEWSDAARADLHKAEGFFALISSVLECTVGMDKISIGELKASAKGNLELVMRLPYSLLSCFHTHKLLEQGLDDSAPAASLIRTDLFGWTRIVTSINVEDEKDVDWTGLMDNEPRLFLHILEGWGGESEELRAKIPVDETFKRRVLDGDFLMADPSSWGSLFKTDEKIARVVRERIRELSPSAPIKRQRYVGEFEPFALNLPSEAELLPHLIGAMLDATGVRHRRENPSGEATRKTLTKWAHVMVSDASALPQIYEDHNLSKRVRVAALVLDLLKRDQLLGDRIKLLNELFDENEGAWLLPAIGYALFHRISAKSSAATELLGNLIDQASNSPMARAAIEPVIVNLRELSGSPVTDTREQAIWH